MENKDVRRNNLEKLATLLERVVPPPEFDMSNSAYVDDEFANELTDKYIKGFDMNEVDMTIIDAGYDYGVLEPALIKAHFSDEIRAGSTYTDRVFGTKINGHFSEKDTNSWHWMFGAVWTGTDNTPKGAAARIRRYLDRGVPDISELGSQEFIARYRLDIYTSVIPVLDYVCGIDEVDEAVRSTYSEYLVP